MAVDVLQGVPELKEHGHLMFAGVGAVAVADQLADVAALVLELHLVCLRPLYDGAPVGAVQAQVTHLVLEVVVPPRSMMSPLAPSWDSSVRGKASSL